MTTTAIEIDMRTEWTKALRSGEYDQAAGMLQTTEGFCCLGVACAVAKSKGLIADFDPGAGQPEPQVDELLSIDASYMTTVHAFEDRVSYLPDHETGRWGYFKTSVVKFYSLIGLNDDAGFTFEDIADVIDEGLLIVDNPDVDQYDLEHEIELSRESITMAEYDEAVNAGRHSVTLS